MVPFLLSAVKLSLVFSLFFKPKKKKKNLHKWYSDVRKEPMTPSSPASYPHTTIVCKKHKWLHMKTVQFLDWMQREHPLPVTPKEKKRWNHAKIHSVNIHKKQYWDVSVSAHVLAALEKIAAFLACSWRCQVHNWALSMLEQGVVRRNNLSSISTALNEQFQTLLKVASSIHMGVLLTLVVCLY